ncbi:MAG: peptidoglycan-binding protein, partial [Candidatus Limnocylindria bacterium]
MSAYRAARTEPRRGRPVLAIGLIVIVAVTLGFLLGIIFRRDDGETAQESPSASPSASVAASVAPSVSASAAP